MSWFGGSKKADAPSESPTTSEFLSSPPTTASSLSQDPQQSSSHDTKVKVMQLIRDEYAIQNAQTLMKKINTTCFNDCITNPGSSLSSSESNCVTGCSEKYMAAFNVVATQVVAKMKAQGGLRVTTLGS